MKYILVILINTFVIFAGISQKRSDTLIEEITFENKKNIHYSPILSKLKADQEFIIKFESTGCFHFVTDKLTIKKKLNEYFVSYKGKTKELSQEEVEAIKSFEEEIKLTSEWACTTVDTYYIIYQDQSQKIIDGTCDWNGFNKLLTNLSLKNN